MGWMTWALNPSSGKKFFSSPNGPDWLWDPPSLLMNRFLCKGKVAWVWCRQLTPSSIKIKSEHSHNFTPPVFFHGADRDNIAYCTAANKNVSHF
jgi:hypothetical protein